ncbi:MAG TPA: GNAT family N-acetyltransferase [Thermoanaerobaculia bacterium]
MIERWGGAPVISRGVAHDPETLRGLVAEDGEGRPVGLLTLELRGEQCEVVTLDAIVPRQGIGTMLLAAAAAEAARAGCRRLWLVTTNDNAGALAFYRKRGLRLVAVHEGAMARSREIKPSIPLVGTNGIPIRDEIELEMALAPRR